MNNQFAIVLPIGRVSIHMGLAKIVDCFQIQVVTGEAVHVASTDDHEFHGLLSEVARNEASHAYHKFDKLIELSHRVRMYPDASLQEAFNDARRKHIVDKLKEAVAKKPVEFYVPDLTLQKVEELAYKYMENMGSDNAALCVFKLSNYHKFAMLIDFEAFRMFVNDSGAFGKFVEMNPNKWVIGRYDNDLAMLKEMQTMRRYEFVPEVKPSEKVDTNVGEDYYEDEDQT